MLSFVVEIPGQSPITCSSRLEALNHASSHCGSTIREITINKYLAFQLPGGPQDVSVPSPPLSLYSSSMAEVSVEGLEYVVTVTSPSGAKKVIKGKPSDGITSPTLITLIGIYHVLNDIQGSVRIISADETLKRIYSNPTRWLNPPVKETYSETISVILKAMIDRKVIVTSSKPLGT